MPRTNNLIFVLLVIIISAPFVSAQTINGFVFDKDSKQTVSNAHILFGNSSDQTYTDAEGQFEISDNSRGQSIIVAHLSYRIASLNIPLEGNTIDTIWLERASVDMDAIVISSKKSDLRKKRLKQFRKDMFNSETISSSLYKKVKILNPEVLLFEEKGDTLFASTQQLIQLRNEYLGYEMQFYLRDYKSTPDLVVCEGTAFFDPAISDRGKSKRAEEEERKRNLWEASAASFYQNLLLQSLDPNANYFERRTDGKDYLLRDFSILYDQVFRTPIQGVYAIAMPYNLVIQYGQYESEIGSMSKIILVNEQGVVINQEEYIQEGYWRRKSITELLPNSYCRNIENELKYIYPQEFSLSTVKQKVNEILYRADNPIAQQIELITDKLIYNQGAVSAVAYVYEYQTSNPIDNQIIHFQLINDKGEIVRRKSTPLIQGYADANFLTLGLLPGKYCIKAFTDYMKELPESTYAYATVALAMKKISGGKTRKKVHLNCSPEARKILLDELNRVLFLIEDDDGQPLDFNGVITDTYLDKTYVLKSIKPGIATADILFDQKSNFIIEGVDMHNLNSFTDYVGNAKLQVIDRGKYFRINVFSDESKKDLILRLVQNGEEIFSQDIDSLTQSIKIEKEFLPEGLILAVIQDEVSRSIISSRYFQNKEVQNLLSIVPEYEFCYNGQSMSMELTNLSDYNLNWTFSITRNEFKESSHKFDHPYLNHLHLISRSLSPIDSVLLTSNIPNAIPSNSFSVSGTIVSAEDSLPTSAYVLLTSLDESM